MKSLSSGSKSHISNLNTTIASIIILSMLQLAIANARSMMESLFHNNHHKEHNQLVSIWTVVAAKARWPTVEIGKTYPTGEPLWEPSR